MNVSEYKIGSVEEAEMFEKSLRDYCEPRGIHLEPFCLKQAYMQFKNPCFDQRCFGAYLDLRLQDIALQRDIKTLCEMANKENRAAKSDGFSEDRMERYIASSNAAHRIRAIWDKIMGFIILIEHPEDYQCFINGRKGGKAKSRLAVFKRIYDEQIESYNNEVPELASFLKSYSDRIVDNASSISDNFRTSEAHSVGRLSKWAFAKQVEEDDPFEIMMDNYNEIRSHMKSLVSMIYLKAAFPESRYE
jgi:hypothetical protein